MIRTVLVLSICVCIAAPTVTIAQGAATTTAPPPTPPPATKLEAFRPAAGSVVTLGYDELGGVNGVSVDVRELVTSGGSASAARGLIVEVTESQYRKERSFVDADEISELLRGIDALLEVKSNPTKFSSFEVRYTTKGEFRVTVFNQGAQIRYAIDAGRTLKASRFVDEQGVRKLREMFVAAQQKLSSLGK